MFVEVVAAGCPNSCRHCAADGRQPCGTYYSADELGQVRAEWGRPEDGSLTWLFHEPTAHADFPDAFAACVGTAHEGHLVTNGYGIARRDDFEDVLRKMQAMGIRQVHLTLHGLREGHDWFVRRKGAFDDIILATRRIREHGFSPGWQVFVDRRNLDEVAALIDLADREVGGPPTLSLAYARVDARLWRYEEIRPSLGDIKDRGLDQLRGVKSNSFARAEELTAAAWLEKWKGEPSGEGYRREFHHVFEPACWPPQPPFRELRVRLLRDRTVVLDPMCAPPIRLGELSEGRPTLLKRLETIPAPPLSSISADDVELDPLESERLHPSGYSLRYSAIMQRRPAGR